MSTTASDPPGFYPYPSLCPWMHVVTLQASSMSRITVTHNGASQSFNVSNLAYNFASVFTEALKIKQAMVTAEKVANALAYDTKPDSVQNDEC